MAEKVFYPPVRRIIISIFHLSSCRRPFLRPSYAHLIPLDSVKESPHGANGTEWGGLLNGNAYGARLRRSFRSIDQAPSTHSNTPSGFSLMAGLVDIGVVARLMLNIYCSSFWDNDIDVGPNPVGLIFVFDSYHSPN